MNVLPTAFGSLEISLTDKEVHRAFCIAKARRLANSLVVDGRIATRFSGDEIDEIGATGELIVHLLTGLRWHKLVAPSMMGSFRKSGQPDLGDDVQVVTRTRLHYQLLLRRNDWLAHRFVLVLAQPPRFIVRGWISGYEGKRREWWDVDLPQPAYLVPDSSLRPLVEMPEMARWFNNAHLPH